MAGLCNLSRERFLAAYQPDRLELDRGTLAADDYWSRIVSLGGLAPTRELVVALEREDALGWTRVNRAMVSWAEELRGAGYRTAILSNMPTEKLSYLRGSPEFSWLADFEETLFSCEHRMVKPEREFYLLCLTRLGVKAAECLFVDDSPVNVAAARAVGIHALLFRSAREAAAVVADTWGLPARSLTNGAAAPEGV